ncbi:DNRLRE domain-containing protein [Streptosporangium sp. 'caverna']|uniref:DNRLRE domain-containing protein n=1 Tax=Streptosporangium sp. 'caverna' TaxID=2202249 RepID=UPI0013A6A711|nr:DNRLRE domain-containing protein [Streptosporangium sp. 'caverna']
MGVAHQRWKVGLASALALAVVGGGPAPMAAFADPAPTGGPVRVDGQPTGAERAAQATAGEQAALAAARSSRQPVEVAELLTETSEVIANPVGSLTLRQHLRPVRTKVSGQWQPIDETLRRNPDGTVSPGATTFGMTFSGGGTAPLATMVKDGKTLSLNWPDPLPAPVLEGDTATYPEVLPGVDLKVVADADGFVHHLIVKNREAARNPRLRTLNFGMSGQGLSVATDETGGVRATDEAGNEVFGAPAPRMWDSSDASATPGDASAASGRARNLASGSVASGQERAPGGERENGPLRNVRMEARVTQDRLEIVPDGAMLDDPATVYPVTIDPIFNGGYKNHWAVAYKKSGSPSLADTSFYDGGNKIGSESPPEARVGYEGDTGGTARSYFEMNIAALKGSTILSSTFNVFNTYSWSCTKTGVELGLTGGINSSTDWNHQPSWSRTLQTKSFAHGWSTSCADAGEDFAAAALKDAVQDAADRNAASITLGLRADDEGSSSGWKRFRVNGTNPVLEVTYNHTPVVVSKAAFRGPWSNNGSDNPIACNNDPATWPLVGNTSVSLIAKLSDSDGGNLTAKFSVWQAGASTVATPSDAVASGGTASVNVAAATFKDGLGYRWTVQAADGTATTGGSGDCGFTVDKTAPTKPTVTAVDGHPLDVAEVAARKPRTIKFASTDAHLDGFCYSLNRPISVGGKCVTGTWVDAANGSATVTIAPPRWPNNRLHVAAIDLAGNTSPYDGSAGAVNTNTTLIVTAAPEFVRDADGSVSGDRDGDLDGDGYVDFLAVAKDARLRLYRGRGDGSIQPGIWYGTGWGGALLAHRGDLIGPESGMGKDGYEDVFARLSDGKLWLYPGNGLGEPQVTGRRELKHPGGTTWASITGLVAPGDIDNQPGADLIVNEGGNLYLYTGTAAGPLATAANGELATPKMIGNGAWADYDVIAPGDVTVDVNGDGVPDPANAADLIARQRSNGNVWIYPGEFDETGSYRLALRRAYGPAGWTPASRPAFTSNGNVQGTVVAVDGGRQFQSTAGQETPDIWSTAPGGTDDSGVLYFYAATPVDRGPVTTVGLDRWTADVAAIF